MKWSADALLELGRSYQAAAVFAAAAELDLFSALKAESLTAAELAQKLGCEERGLAILLDALSSLGLLMKTGQRYCLPPAARPYLTSESPQTILSMAQHQANCLRRWAQLAQVVKSGKPAERVPSVRGEAGDTQSFIGAMQNISGPVADKIIQGIQPLQFKHLLDVGGASGTWTAAFLRACLAAKATLFDLPDVLPLARRYLGLVGLAERVKLVAGDFLKDGLPGGADLAWVSAIVHQNSRQENRLLFGKVFGALQPKGRIAIRDILMDATRTKPVAGALFAVNMLVATEGGGTFTFEELAEDLQAVGFTAPTVAARDEGMNSIIIAEKPASA